MLRGAVRTLFDRGESERLSSIKTAILGILRIFFYFFSCEVDSWHGTISTKTYDRFSQENIQNVALR